jgi:hypothetical protein
MAASAKPTSRKPIMTSAGAVVASAKVIPKVSNSPAASRVRRLPRRPMVQPARLKSAKSTVKHPAHRPKTPKAESKRTSTLRLRT